MVSVGIVWYLLYYLNIFEIYIFIPFDFNIFIWCDNGGKGKEEG